MSVSIAAAGEFEGRRVDEARLTGADGVEISILNWGVVVRDWLVPAPEGQRHAVLGFDSFAPYPANGGAHLGAIAGRVANRIGGASFTRDGRTYRLAANEGANMLHGGQGGLGRQLWEMAPDAAANAVRFTLHSPDGEMGFPGAVDFTATYTLTGHTLRLELTGQPDRPTPISLVQHIYFNLGMTGTVLDHTVHMPHSVARTETDAQLVPSGVISPVMGTQYDFTAPRALRGRDGQPLDYDLNYVLATGRDRQAPVAVVSGEDGALTLTLKSDRPGLQFYNGVMTDIAEPGHGGRRYGRYSGLCLEDQMWPDALNHPHFPDIVCTPDAPYRHWCEMTIS